MVSRLDMVNSRSSSYPDSILFRMSSWGGIHMYGAFGGYTRWAVVFLIIFALFILLVPAAGGVDG